MGNILSNDEKLLSQEKRELFAIKKHRHHYSDRLPNRSQYYKYKKKKANFLYKDESTQNLRIRSQSLDAIIDDFYWLETENIIENKLIEIKFDANKPLIPRIKLRKVPINKQEGHYKQLLKMSSEPQLLTTPDSTNSSTNLHLKDQNDDCFHNDDRLLNRLTILINDKNYEEIPNKPEDNYFSKNFDDSIKRLQQIEKEHELIENDDSDIEIYLCKNNTGKMETTESNKEFHKENYNTKIELKNLENGSENQDWITINSKNQSENCERDGKKEINKETDSQKKLTDNSTIANKTSENEESKETENQERISEWYSNLKERFEKGEQENDHAVQEISCRITGAILKSTNEHSKPEEKEKDTRHYFSKLVKSNKSFIDEELPDPDKVKNIRAMFQENLNSTLKKRLDKKLGGSLQNINVRTSEQNLIRPLSAQCYRNDETQDDQKFKNTSATDISGTVKDDGKEYSMDRKKLLEKYEKDLKLGRDLRCRKFLQPKWTDTGSLSSGVSSDLSSYDTDIESFSKEGTEQDEIVVSDDDLLEEVNDKHYVQNEVLEKIRSFGTSVTYYGGEMISCSVGPLLSPTTQAIMEEISEKYGREPTGTRSFEEFYRKYVETNEPNRKKKLGRTRSFGQSDVFQKPNVLNNSEIDMFKNDLEIEIGIKKPVGISQNSLKRKAIKSASLENAVQKEEKEKTQSCLETVLKSEPTKKNGADDKISTSDQQISTTEESISRREGENVVLNNNTVEEINNKKIDTDECTINKNIETEQELTKVIKKEGLFKRAQSAPVGTLIGETHLKGEMSHHTATEEILFGYEKTLLNGKVKQDMEFEEFEVCESVEEKLEKLEEKNSQNLTETKRMSATNGNADEENYDENISPDNKHHKIFSDSEKGGIENEILDVKFKRQISAPEKEEKSKGDKFSKYNCSKWPIETTVMVDIQKTSEQTPKVVKNEKSIAKTKLRLF